jgi:tetratricopeptide (TPR) repeat protein
MTDREKRRESGDILEHMPLEEIHIEDIRYMEPPEEWAPELHDREPYAPPVLIEETGGNGEEEDLYTAGSGRYSLLAHHRSFWRTQSRGHLSTRALVVRSSVHITLAHQSIANCTEEALLFEGLLRNSLVENRSRLSDMLGYSRARITQILNLLKLPQEMRRKLLLTDDISEFQLRPLIRVTDPPQQMEMFNRLVLSKLTGRQMALFANARQDDEEVPAPDLESMVLSAPDLATMPDRGVERGAEKGADRGADRGPDRGADRGAERRVEPGTERVSEPAEKVPQKVRETREGPKAHAQRIAQTILRLGSLREAGWEIRARQMGLGEVDIMLLRGISLLRSGLYPQAVEILEVVIENDAGLSPAYFYMGRSFNLTGNYPAAEGFLRTALELVPDNPDYMVELAIVLEKLKRHTEASTFYKRAGAIRKKQVEGREL